MGFGLSREPFTLQNISSEPYMSGPAGPPHSDEPPVSVPTILFSLSRRGEPDDPPSVAAVSQSLTIQKALGSVSMVYLLSLKEPRVNRSSSMATFLIPPFG